LFSLKGCYDFKRKPNAYLRDQEVVKSALEAEGKGVKANTSDE
jgi:hypothetical protein